MRKIILSIVFTIMLIITILTVTVGIPGIIHSHKELSDQKKTTESKLDELSEICDIMFIFPGGSQSIVKCDKFTNLCSGNAWIVGNWRKTIFVTQR